MGVNTVGQQVKKILDEKNLKQSDLIKFLLGKQNIDGKDRTQFSRYLSGIHSYPEEYIIKTSMFLKIDPKILFTNEKSSFFDIAQVPVKGTASCGACDVSIFEDKNRYSSIRSDRYNNKMYAVIACGDSMSPEIDNGDEVIIDPTVEPQNGDLVLYRIDDEYAIKILSIDKEAYIMQFVPYNPSEEFKTRTIRLDDDFTMNRLTWHKVVRINKNLQNNRSARLKMIGR